MGVQAALHLVQRLLDACAWICVEDNVGRTSRALPSLNVRPFVAVPALEPLLGLIQLVTHVGELMGRGPCSGRVKAPSQCEEVTLDGQQLGAFGVEVLIGHGPTYGANEVVIPSVIDQCQGFVGRRTFQCYEAERSGGGEDYSSGADDFCSDQRKVARGLG